jgi:hypothetical protein
MGFRELLLSERSKSEGRLGDIFKHLLTGGRDLVLEV